MHALTDCDLELSIANMKLLLQQQARGYSPYSCTPTQAQEEVYGTSVPFLAHSLTTGLARIV